jgi:DNA-binding MarR family transcriptional regulator
VFGTISPEGGRLTDLAERAQMTKQAVGEVASELEKMGYVERVPDPADGRAKIIRLTGRGSEAWVLGRQVFDEIRERWEAEYGAERVRAMVELLEEMALDLRPVLGRPERRAA